MRRVRDGNGFFAERDKCLAVDSCDGCGLQGGDLGEWLCVEEQQDAGDAVGKAFGVAGEQFLKPREALALGDRRGCSGLPEPDLDRTVDLAAFGPHEECPDQVASGRP
jgi:hypothetical protein